MNKFGLQFHHFGLAVRKPDEALRYLNALGYVQGATCFDGHQRVNLAMCHHDSMPDVELIWPGREPSPIDQMLKRNETLIYHLCYTSKSVEKSIASIENAGFQILAVSLPVPAPLFDGLEVSFHSIGGFGIIEIIEIPELT
jgi:hypothetical protein